MAEKLGPTPEPVRKWVCPGILLLASSGVLGEPGFVAVGEVVVVLGATFKR